MRRLPPNFHSYEHGSIAAPRWTFLAPALAILPLVRYPLGYETLSPWVALKRAAAFAAIVTVFWFLMELLTHAPPPAIEGREVFYGFVVLTFLITLLRFGRRTVRQDKGEEIHTAEAGYSIVTRWLRLPVKGGEQLIMPALLGWSGWEIAHSVSVDLGYWLIVCAVSYLILANWEMRNLAARKRAPVDDKIRAQAFSDQVDEHEVQAAQAKRRGQKGKQAPLYDADEMPELARQGRR